MSYSLFLFITFLIKTKTSKSAIIIIVIAIHIKIKISCGRLWCKLIKYGTSDLYYLTKLLHFVNNPAFGL
jgi:hypothetical protein